MSNSSSIVLYLLKAYATVIPDTTLVKCEKVDDEMFIAQLSSVTRVLFVQNVIFFRMFNLERS